MKSSAIAPLLAALLLGACASSPSETPASTPTDQAVAVTPAPPEEAVVPERVNHTPFPGFTLICDGQCSAEAGQDYYTWDVKLSFDIDRRGKLKVSEYQEPGLAMEDDPAQDRVCGEKGSTGNQRNTWFPYTGIFVRGGKLQSVRDAGGKQLQLWELSPIEGGDMMFVGNEDGVAEWSYVPCVGPHRVDAGARLDGFLPPGAVLTVKPDKGVPTRLSLPEPTEPYLLLRYRSGAMIPVPMRPVLITVDLTERRLVAYFQSTFPVAPPLRKIELRAILPGQKPDKSETAERFRERSQAALQDLRRCAVPNRPMEPCATSERRPDRRIFSR